MFAFSVIERLTLVTELFEPSLIPMQCRHELVDQNETIGVSAYLLNVGSCFVLVTVMG